MDWAGQWWLFFIRQPCNISRPYFWLQRGWCPKSCTPTSVKTSHHRVLFILAKFSATYKSSKIAVRGSLEEFRAEILTLKLVVVERIGFHHFVLANTKGTTLQLPGRTRWGRSVTYLDLAGLGALLLVAEKTLVGNGLSIINSAEWGRYWACGWVGR